MTLVGHWDTARDGAMSPRAIRALYSPDNMYRVTQVTYGAGIRFPGTMRPGKVYVLSGNCEYTFSDSSVTLGTEQILEHSGGEFWFSVVGDTLCTLVSVWEIPPAFRATSRPE